MPLTPEIQKKIGEGNLLESAGQHEEAEKTYLQVLDAIDNDPGLIGTVYINLGTNASAADRVDDAVRFWLKAIEYLVDQKGEYIVQLAHAHYNLSDLYLHGDDPEKAIVHADQALQHYLSYPFTSREDIADAIVLHVIAEIYTAAREKIPLVIRSFLSESGLREAWQTVRQASAVVMRRDLLLDFLINYLSIQMQFGADLYQRAIAEATEWAGEELLKPVFDSLERINQHT
jgi:tetratricopeptide (TPR) repeat protein